MWLILMSEAGLGRAVPARTIRPSGRSLSRLLKPGTSKEGSERVHVEANFVRRINPVDAFKMRGAKY
ncbi:MAG TPA: hypothetical protein VKY22_00785 [Bradyrhizobium sp.]|nr:hypothetical protein [Bradyrhizobium sp.]